MINLLHKTICPDFVLLLRNKNAREKKGRGEEKKGKGGRKKRWEKRGFSPSLLKRFSSPLPFFGKEKYDVTGIVFLKNYTKLGKIGLCPILCWMSWINNNFSITVSKTFKILWIRADSHSYWKIIYSIDLQTIFHEY